MRATTLLMLFLAAQAATAQPVALPTLPRSPSAEGLAARAYLYSVAVTAGGTALGYSLYRALPGPAEAGELAPRDAGAAVAAMFLIVGPSVGNISLAANADVELAIIAKSVGLGAGGAYLLGSMVGCALSLGGSSLACETMFTGSLVLAAAGLVVGTAVDLGTIPRNARRTADERQRRHAIVAPSGAGVVVRVPL